MKTTLEETLSELYCKYGTSAIFLKMTAVNAPIGSFIQLMEHPTKRMASYVLKVNKRFASICLMLPATELDDDCPMIEVEKITIKKFSMDFVERVLTREYRHFMKQRSINQIAADFARATTPASSVNVWSSFKPKHA